MLDFKAKVRENASVSLLSFSNIVFSFSVMIQMFSCLNDCAADIQKNLIFAVSFSNDLLIWAEVLPFLFHSSFHG